MATQKNEKRPVPAPYAVLRPRRGWQSLDLGEIWQFRDLLLALAMRDVKLRYRQTALGVVWVVLQPLIAAGIFAFVFGRVARLASPGGSYFLFAYAGLMGWQAFHTTLTRAGTSLIQNASLISRVYFPRLILPLSVAFAAVIDAGVSLVLFLGLMRAQSVSLPVGFLTFPLWLGALVLLGASIGLYAAAAMARYRDVQYVLPVFSQFLLYASPVGYATTAVPESARTIFLLNPLAGLLDALRWSLLGSPAPHWPAVLYAVGVSLATFLCGMIAFRRLERNLADVI
ncbi:MAG: ABC transporter permease [Chloroherpetonaceae bacterium]|nr:ABC transporter permease [Chthonomonadaceae bacterium]MDW8206704.1 ABC transporter permease [Chloroherpetonaceae bacterium]